MVRPPAHLVGPMTKDTRDRRCSVPPPAAAPDGPRRIDANHTFEEATATEVERFYATKILGLHTLMHAFFIHVCTVLLVVIPHLLFWCRTDAPDAISGEMWRCVFVAWIQIVETGGQRGIVVKALCHCDRQPSDEARRAACRRLFQPAASNPGVDVLSRHTVDRRRAQLYGQQGDCARAN